MQTHAVTRKSGQDGEQYKSPPEINFLPGRSSGILAGDSSERYVSRLSGYVAGYNFVRRDG